LRGRKLLAVAGSVAALSLAVGACGSSDDTDSTSGSSGETSLDLKIGNVLSLSGDLADYGPSGEKASDLAVSEINKAIEENGSDHTVTATTEDDQTTDSAGVQAARKVVGEGASCITGAYASSVTIPIARSVSIREGVLQISPASTSDEITGLEDDGLLNRTAPPDALQGPTLANAIADDLGGAEGKTVNIGARNDSYGTGLSGTFTDAWEALGGTVGETVIYDPEQPSYDSEASQIVSGSPDATVIIDFPETFAKVGPALVRTGDFDPTTTWGTDGLASGDVAAQGGDDYEGFRGTAPGSPDKDEAATAFDDLFTSSDPKDVDRNTFDAQNFDATILCYLSAVAAGSTDGADMAAQLSAVSSPPGDEYSWEELPAAVKALQDGQDIDYVGASGGVDIDEAGDATSGVYDVYTFKGGDIAITGEVPIATE
jgi:branched-chain amino acid transport system substrate-binding protein